MQRIIIMMFIREKSCRNDVAEYDNNDKLYY